jgi:hypothetical protein
LTDQQEQRVYIVLENYNESIKNHPRKIPINKPDDVRITSDQVDSSVRMVITAMPKVT